MNTQSISKNKLIVIARVLSFISAAGYLAFFVTPYILNGHHSEGMLTALLFLIIPVAALVIVAWKWNLVGGIILLAYSVIGIVCMFIGDFGDPLGVSGKLMLLSIGFWILLTAGIFYIQAARRENPPA